MRPRHVLPNAVAGQQETIPNRTILAADLGLRRLLAAKGLVQPVPVRMGFHRHSVAEADMIAQIGDAEAEHPEQAVVAQPMARRPSLLVVGIGHKAAIP